MGNTNNSTKYYENCFTNINEEGIHRIRSLYTVIDVDWLDRTLVNYKLFNNEFFTERPNKKEIVDDMLDFYLNNKNEAIYKKTDYLCNEKAKICICNTHAEDFRKIYDGVNYEPNVKYISWCEKYTNLK